MRSRTGTPARRPARSQALQHADGGSQLTGTPGQAPIRVPRRTDSASRKGGRGDDQGRATRSPSGRRSKNLGVGVDKAGSASVPTDESQGQRDGGPSGYGRRRGSDSLGRPARVGAAPRACGGWRACAVGPAGALGMRPLSGGSSLPLRASEEDGWRASGWRGRSLRRTFPSQSRATPVWVDRSNFERRRPRPGPGRRTWSRTAPPPALLEGTRRREAPGGQTAPARVFPGPGRRGDGDRRRLA